MKNNYIIITLVLAMFTFSCDDDLNIAPQSVVTVTSFFSSEDDVRSARNGMYVQLRDIMESDQYLYGDERAENTEQTDLGTGNDVNRNTIDPTTGGTDWGAFYSLLKDVNLLLIKSEDVDFRDQSQKNDILAEAYFIRAWTYFMLVRVWGDAPIILLPIESPDQPDLLPERRDPVSAVYDQIKMDIETSLSLFSSDEITDRSYASKVAANMLKAYVYVTTAKVEGGGATDLGTAQAAINQVVSSTDLALQPTFLDVFRSTQATSEDIFTLFKSLDEGGGFFASRYNVSDSFWASLSDADKAVIPFITGSVRFYTTTQVFRDQIVANANGNIDVREKVYFLEYSDPSGETRHIMNKYQGETVGTSNQWTDDVKIYRLADAILLKAEIENALGNTAEAIVQLNLIRNRAGIGDYSGAVDQSDVDEAILNERGVELAFEGKRWFDLVRFGKAYELVPSLIGRESEQPILWPVSLGTISLNPNLEQTPGY
ncbi:MAG: hypothetical protein DHS20C17_22480 [Cyclobacteriaceae bacterium]|nr:MAG: hypothetical protein DHS20C17_22480 [Cyclobacteriaceae bacterium]